MYKFAYFGRAHILHYVAGYVNKLGRSGHAVVELIKAVKAKEIEKANSVDGVLLRFALYVKLLRPEFRRQCYRDQVLEVARTPSPAGTV